ncbi:TPA: hypothetical protein ACNEJR_003701 [Escherichia coli]
MEWRRTPINFVGVVDALYVGRWRVGHVTSNFTYPNPPDGLFTFYCHLPGVPHTKEPYANEAGAKKALESVVRNWITQAGFNP